MAAVQPRPMRIAYLADPNSVHTRRWIGFFAERGHDVHLLVGIDDDVRPGLDARVRLHRYRRFGARRVPFLSSLQGRRALRSLLAEIRPDVLHAHYLSRFGWQARLSGFHPYVVTTWGSDLFVTLTRSRRARLWGRATLRAADMVTVVSRQMHEAVLAAGARPERVERVQFGVDTRRFSPAPESTAEPGGGAVPTGRFVFSPRTIRPLYRHETVIEALATLPSDVRVVMTGRGADPAYRQQLEARAASAGVAERILVEAEIDDDRMLALYRACVTVVSVPESDGLPVTLLEAMACGAPPVVSDLPAAREMLEGVAPQLIAPVGDAAAVAASLGAVLGMSSEDRRTLGDTLRARVVDEADQQTNMLRMESLYRRLAQR